MAKKQKWMQEALGKRPGALRQQLGVPKEAKIPKTLLVKIVKADVGTVIANPAATGKRRYRVTRLMKRRALPVLTAARFRRRRRGRLVR